MSLRRNPSRTIASWTSAAVSGRTPGSSLTTRDTVLRLTPAAWATSAIVGRALPSSSLAAVSVTLLDNVVNGAPAQDGPLQGSYAAAATAPVIIATTASRVVAPVS